MIAWISSPFSSPASSSCRPNSITPRRTHTMLPPPLPQPRTFSLSPFKTAPPPPHQELFAFTTVLPLLTLLTPPSTTSLFSRLPSPPITPSLMHPSILSLFLTHNIPSLSSTSLIYLPLFLCLQQFLIYLHSHLA